VHSFGGFQQEGAPLDEDEFDLKRREIFRETPLGDVCVG